MIRTINRSIALAVAALWSLPASAGDIPPPSVYVAPGGVYIGSARVYVGPGVGNGGQAHVVPGAAYVPGYGPPAPVYGPGYAVPVPAPAYAPETYGPETYGPESSYGPEYGVPGAAYAPGYAPAPVYRAPPLSVYGARPALRARRAYVSPYEFAPRPPVAVPYNGGAYNGGGRCVAAYGRVICD
jgi:hypothetical protein